MTSVTIEGTRPVAHPGGSTPSSKPVATPKFNAPSTTVQPHPGPKGDKTYPVALEQPVEGLYLHVPFCFHKCHYCDFYSVEHDAATEGDRQHAFTQALLRDLETQAHRFELRPGTVFVGGGTPTILAPPHWTDILGALHKLGVLSRVTEFTVEANPETVTAELAGVLSSGGVNRVSIGAQSFNPRHLKTLERWHDPKNVARAMGHFREAGITNINVDLIFGIPGQSLADVETDLAAALALEPTHLSYYGLTYEPNTALTSRLRLGQVQRIDEDLERDMYALILDRLAAAGFEHYEISAWARRGCAMWDGGRGEGSGSTTHNTPHPIPLYCRHNLTYWTCGNYLGIGPGAATHLDGQRWKVAPRISDYIAAAPLPPIIDVETLTASQRNVERLMMNLRLRDGVPLQWFDAAITDQRRTNELIAIGLLERTDTHLRLTHEGLFVSDTVIAELL